MSYTYLQEQAAESSAECFSDIPAYVLSRLSLTAEKACCNASETESCQSSQSGTTCEHLTANRGAGSLTQFAGGFHAKAFHRSVNATGLITQKADCGKKWPESLARFDHDSFSWRTRQSCLITEDLELLETLPDWGMELNGELWRLPTLVQTTREKDYGFLPTPRCSRGYTNPTLGKSRNDCLTTVLLGKPALGMRPHPNFVEWMMGWPIGWTECTPLETAKFQSWLHLHGEF